MKSTSTLLTTAVSAIVILTSSQPSLAALVALWRFESSGTSQQDLSINANTATAMNGATQVFDIDRNSGTMSFDGSDDFLEVAHSSSLAITGDMTIALWVNIAGIGTDGQWRGIMAKDPTGSGNPAPYQFWFNQGSNYVPAFGRGDGTNLDFAFGIDKPRIDGVWEHWAVTMSGTTVTMYRDGLPISMSDSFVSTANIADQGGVLIIGDRPGAQDMSFFGRMDDVAIFDHALSQADIQTIMNGDFSAYPIPEPTRALLLLSSLIVMTWRRQRPRI